MQVICNIPSSKAELSNDVHQCGSAIVQCLCAKVSKVPQIYFSGIGFVGRRSSGDSRLQR